jgi:hypothetical protein
MSGLGSLVSVSAMLETASAKPSLSIPGLEASPLLRGEILYDELSFKEACELMK